MIYNLLPIKDTTIYSEYPNMNAGLDEILELQKYYKDNSTYYSRILISFNQQQIESYPTHSSEYELKLWEVDNQSIPLNYDIYCYPISGNWDMGVGKVEYSPQLKSGANWYYRNGSVLKTPWNANNDYGGSWYTSSISSQSFEAFTSDLSMDVTNIVNQWTSKIIDNNGFILKRSNNDEGNNENMGNLKYFSSNTNTIFKPKLSIKWDDSIYSPNTGSQEILDMNNSFIYYPLNLSHKYNYNSKIRINMYCRSQYPSKNYFNKYRDNTKYYISQSYYSVIDEASNEIIIPFDNDYTKISVDENGNYFNLWLNQFSIGRNYKIIVKVINGDNIYYFDNNYIFKVIK